MVSREHWRAAAACREADPGLFFPRSYSAANVRDAAAWCSACPVTAQCLQLAVAHWQPHGIYAGRTPTQLKKLADVRPSSHGGSFRQLKPHGSWGAITRHRRDETDLCEACWQFQQARVAERKAARKQRRQQEKVAS
jgi:WhiB family redox-sensing transcriptional regulator